MTDAIGQSNAGGSDFIGQMQALAQRFGRWIGKLGFGLLVVAALFVALVATTFIGVLLAAAALFLMLTRKRAKASARTVQGGTLDATQTADGWVIETSSSRW